MVIPELPNENSKNRNLKNFSYFKNQDCESKAFESTKISRIVTLMSLIICIVDLKGK